MYKICPHGKQNHIQSCHMPSLRITKQCRAWSSALIDWLVGFNPLHAKFFRGNKNIYLHLMSFLHIGMTRAVEILPQVRQELACSKWSISWVLMSWQCKEPGHQQPWYLCWTELIWSLHDKGWCCFRLRTTISRRVTHSSTLEENACLVENASTLGCLQNLLVSLLLKRISNRI